MRKERRHELTLPAAHDALAALASPSASLLTSGRAGIASESPTVRLDAATTLAT